MSAQHTPGPWVALRDRRRTSPWRIEGDGGMLAEVLAQGSFGTALPEETEANARLISAAPELLAALVGLYELCTLGASEDAFRNGVTDSHGIVDEGDARAFDRISAARAAIRKAGAENA